MRGDKNVRILLLFLFSLIKRLLARLQTACSSSRFFFAPTPVESSSHIAKCEKEKRGGEDESSLEFFPHLRNRAMSLLAIFSPPEHLSVGDIESRTVLPRGKKVSQLLFSLLAISSARFAVAVIATMCVCVRCGAIKVPARSSFIVLRTTGIARLREYLLFSWSLLFPQKQRLLYFGEIILICPPPFSGLRQACQE